MVQLLEINVIFRFGVPNFVLKFTTKDGLKSFQNYVRFMTLTINTWHLVTHSAIGWQKGW
jgi:hypothetical protein